MEIDFIKTSPTENMTILVKTPLPQEEHLAVAEKLMAYNSIYGEQVGFIQEPKDKHAVKALRMMAGEFCGNATLSLAAYLMEEKKLPLNATETVLLEVSGAKNLVPCEMQKLEVGYLGKVSMPLPLSMDWEELALDGETFTLPVVRFEGIAHIIVERSIWGEYARVKAEKASTLWSDSMPNAFGILLWDSETQSLEPLVCVKGTSLIWERGCGSGTSAIGVFLAMQAGRTVSVDCNQPGGTMGVQVVMKDGKITALEISGHVSIVAKGKAYI